MSRADILSLLKSHDVMPTPQRMEVAEVLLDHAQHLSADQIMDRLREGGSVVSKARSSNTSATSIRCGVGMTSWLFSNDRMSALDMVIVLVFLYRQSID